MMLIHHGFLGLVLLGLPALALTQGLLLARVDPEGRELALHRTTLYRDTGLVLAALGATALALGWDRFGWEEMGLAAPPQGVPGLLAWTGAGVAGGLAVVAAAHGLGSLLRVPEPRLVEALLPVDGPERIHFAGVSAAAGIGEEAAFRGYALSALLPTVGPLAAVGATSLAFGLAHAYQGLLGIARTTLVGVVLAALTLASGSLWPAMGAHALLNLLLGLAGGRRLLRRP